MWDKITWYIYVKFVLIGNIFLYFTSILIEILLYIDRENCCNVYYYTHTQHNHRLKALTLFNIKLDQAVLVIGVKCKVKII